MEINNRKLKTTNDSSKNPTSQSLLNFVAKSTADSEREPKIMLKF